MPATCPRIQLFGSGFGQNGSTWNWGIQPIFATAAGLTTVVWASAEVDTNAVMAIHRVVIFMLSSQAILLEHENGQWSFIVARSNCNKRSSPQARRRRQSRR